MERRIFGLENEYSTCEKSRDGFISVSGSSVFPSWFIRLKENPVIKKYKLSSETYQDTIDGWIGANGGRFYLDINGKFIPEYATPECDSPRVAAIHDKAGELFLHELRTAIAKEYEERNEEKPPSVIISKNTTVGDQGPLTTSYVGVHENYLYNNSIFLKEADKTTLRNFLGPFFASRVIINGAGGIRKDSDGRWRYVISQRAFKAASDRCFVTEKPDEYNQNTLIRLHIVHGDPNMSPFATYLKLGTAHLVLRAAEESCIANPPVELPDNSHRALTAFSQDTSLQKTVRDELRKKNYRALDIQYEYLHYVHRAVHSLSEEDKQILRDWEWVLVALERNPEELHRHLDWVTKLVHMRHTTNDFGNPKARMFDFLYSDISPAGIYNRLRKNGYVYEFVSDAEIERTGLTPPRTRASVRARYLTEVFEKNFPYFYVNWNLVHGVNGVRLNDPFETTSESLEKMLEEIAKGIWPSSLQQPDSEFYGDL